MDDKSNILIVDDLPEKLLVFKTILEELDQNLIMVRSGSCYKCANCGTTSGCA